MIFVDIYKCKNPLTEKIRIFLRRFVFVSFLFMAFLMLAIPGFSWTTGINIVSRFSFLKPYAALIILFILATYISFRYYMYITSENDNTDGCYKWTKGAQALQKHQTEPKNTSDT